MNITTEFKSVQFKPRGHQFAKFVPGLSFVNVHYYFYLINKEIKINR